jgi:hypothetical protein
LKEKESERVGKTKKVKKLLLARGRGRNRRGKENMLVGIREENQKGPRRLSDDAAPGRCS